MRSFGMTTCEVEISRRERHQKVGVLAALGPRRKPGGLGREPDGRRSRSERRWDVVDEESVERLLRDVTGMHKCRHEG